MFKILVVLILFSCTKNNQGSPPVFGHAGMGLSMENSLYHDNSKESIELCLALPNSDGVEVDVQMDNQGELWLYHDEFLDNISSHDGCVNEKTTFQLEQAFYKTLKKEKLVKLSQIAPLIKQNQKLFLDVKNRNACSKTIINFSQFQESLSKILGNNTFNVYVILSDSNWLDSLSEIYQVYYSTDNFSEGYNILIENTKVRGIVIRNKAIEKSQIEAIKNQNKEVYLYDIRSPKGNRVAFEKNPSGIITDDIRSALLLK
jgi:glycerophosphoryl diester phosphodiesterase